MSGLLLAGTHSGCGKTLVSLALMAFLRQRGLRVQPFKVGPDFIDPGHHQTLCGRPSQNLDSWMLSRQKNLEIFQRYASQGDVSIVEGVMGLFDGFSPIQEIGSSAEVAKWLGLPVLLVLDVRSMARSVAALVQGYVSFDLQLNIAGVICNRVGSESHAELLKQSLNHYNQPPAVACLPLAPDLELPSRHLGLVTAQEQGWSKNEQDSLMQWLQKGLDQDLLDNILNCVPLSEQPGQSTISQKLAFCTGPAAISSKPTRGPIRLGIAWDEAFCFYYHENLRLLENAGAELCFFSPLQDLDLPSNLQGIYLGGGYPELYAAQLAANQSLKGQILDFASAGKTIYAECGGFMYLMQSITDLQGKQHKMIGFFNLQARMCDRFQALGYREVVLQDHSPLGFAGSVIKGHEFHYSRIEQNMEQCSNIYAVMDRKGINRETASFCKKNVLGSYIHLHFGSFEQGAENLVQCCKNEANDK